MAEINLEKAKCRNIPNPEIFFPINESRFNAAHYTQNIEQVEGALQALELCDSCQVRQECLNFCLQAKETALNGIWGGTLDVERRQMLGKPSEKAEILLAQRIRQQANRRGIPYYVISKPEKEIESCLENIVPTLSRPVPLQPLSDLE